MTVLSAPRRRRRPDTGENAEFSFAREKSVFTRPHVRIAKELALFSEFGQRTKRFPIRFRVANADASVVEAFVNEFWTAKQRAASRLHEISYRACFKPQLPRFFIERLTKPGGVVYDPFMGRGTTLLEAALMGRTPYGCDVSPLSTMLIRPRLGLPELREVETRLQEIDFCAGGESWDDLQVFYHPETLKEIVSLKNYFLDRHRGGKMDRIDEWIRLVALNRLTGHSTGFFSVYTMPPNQAVSLKSQRKINERRKQTPLRRNVPSIILRKSRQLLDGITPRSRKRLAAASEGSILLTNPASTTPAIASGSVNLVVTSPPFLDVVDYAGDNWLRCWFVAIDPSSVNLTVPNRIEEWGKEMARVFEELHRVLKPGGHVAFEVGEVRRGTIKLEEVILPIGVGAGLKPRLVLINDQTFTKTANCWGVDNNSKGTNSNRIVLFQKQDT